MQPKLLVIAFYFPPFNMVAARRWAKHLKYMFRDGVDFYVLTREFENKNAPWDKDILPFKNRITRLNYTPKHPYFKLRLPNSFLQKVRWKLSLLKWNHIKKRENTLIGDESIGAENIFLENAIKLIEEKKITHVILTVGPFRFSTILPELKRRFPQVKFTIDYRDYWHDSKEALAHSLFEKEMKFQEEVLKNVDTITVVNEEMKAHFSTKTAGSKSILVLPHCFDPEDVQAFDSVKPTPYEKNRTLKFIYGGALYSEMTNYIHLYLDFIKRLSGEGWDSHSDFYIPYKAYTAEFEKAKDKMTLSSYLTSTEYFETLVKQDFVIYFRPDWSPNAFSSKFFELIALRKPVLYFGPKSDVSAFIETNKLGIHFATDNFEHALKKFFDLLQNSWRIDSSYNIEQHTFAYYNNRVYDFLDLKKESVS